jgi:protein SCO1/2
MTRRRLQRKAAFVFALSLLLRPGGAPAASTGRAAPDFVLVDQHGRTFELAHVRGHPVVLFFGYTHCPDECPTVLATLAKARKAAGPLARDVMVAMITVDPARDGAAALGRFVELFDPSFLGLRGSDGRLRSVYRSYDVKIARTPDDVDEVSHSTFVYYIGRAGRIMGLGSSRDPPAILEEDIANVARPSS